MIVNADEAYDHAFEVDNVYGHALDLTTRRLDAEAASQGAIHLDLGCGFGRIAEKIAAVGMVYVGIDGDGRGLASLAERSFETHQYLFSAGKDIRADLAAIVGGRRVASITFLDTLEHLEEGDEVLAAIAAIAHEHRAPLVISVPNMSHRDIGLKLAFGRWDYTEKGLLDHTHVRLFDEKLILRTLRRAGLHAVDHRHVHRAASDQHFPAGHPALATGSNLAVLLRDLRKRVDGFDDVTQFVYLCVAGPRTLETRFSPPEPAEAPFLSVVTRTQGKRISSLREVFCCLAGQTCDDFEVLVLAHKTEIDDQRAVERVIEDNPKWLRDKIRLLLVDRGNRTHPINVGFEAARGDYVAILDDDDLPMAHWVETFKDLAAKGAGKVLRAANVRQDTVFAKVEGRQGLRAEGGLLRLYPSRFDLFDHLHENRTPPVSLAFPRGLFHDLGFVFDEDLDTMEDWDYLMRAALLVGVADDPTVTSVYRWWVGEESSRTVHSEQIWVENRRHILQKFDKLSLVLPPGSAVRIREPTHSIAVRSPRLSRALALLESTSWRVSAPVRWIGRRTGGGRPLQPSQCLEMDDAQLERAIMAIESSMSWRLTGILRRLKRG